MENDKNIDIMHVWCEVRHKISKVGIKRGSLFHISSCIHSLIL